MRFAITSVQSGMTLGYRFMRQGPHSRPTKFEEVPDTGAITQR